MSGRKSTKERLDAIKEKQLEAKRRFEEEQRKLKAQEKRLAARAKVEEQKARTHRLIELGAAIESVCGIPIENTDLPKIIGFLNRQEKSGHCFSSAMGYDHSTDSEGNVTYFFQDEGGNYED